MITIAYDATASDIETAANNTSGFGTQGGVTVSMPEGINEGFLVEWVVNGARDLITGDAFTLQPACNVVVTRVQTGDSTHQEVQLVQFVQAPFITVGDWTAISTPLATVTELRTGSVSAQAKYQVALSDLVYGGSFSVDSSDGAGTSVPYNVADVDLTAAMAGAWTATKIDDRTWTLERDAVGVATIDLSTGVVTAGLLAYTGVTGTFSVNSGAIWRKFATVTTPYIEAILQIRIAGETVYYASGIPIYRDILNGDAAAAVVVDSQRVRGVALTNGSLTGSVTFPSAMSAVPIVWPVVRAPSGEGPGFVAVVGDPTTEGFDFVLLGAPTSGNWKLDYLAIIPS